MLKQLGVFRDTFHNSLFKPAYYQNITVFSFWFSVRYLFVLVFITIFLQAAAICIVLLPQVSQFPAFIDAFKTRLHLIYPDDLVIHIEDGVLSLNKKTPYYIDIPELQDNNTYNHLITFDTASSPAEYPSFHTIILITQNEVVYPQQLDQNNEYHSAPFQPDERPFTVEKDSYDQFIKQFEPFLNWIAGHGFLILAGGLMLIPLVTAVIGTAWHMLYLLVLSVFLLIIAQLFSVKKDYWQMYQMGLHGLTVPIVFSLILGIAGLSFPLVFTSSFMLWMVYVLLKFPTHSPKV